LKLNDDLRQKLAAEYALGTLRGSARERLERWMREDPDLAREVRAWETRLAPMAEAVAPVEPPARVWRGVQRRLDLPKRFSFWKDLALVAAGAAAALVAVALLLPVQRGAPASYVAVLNDPKSARPVLIATAERSDNVLRLNVLEPRIHVSEHSLELWALPQGGKPWSLGLVSAQERSSLKLPARADQSLGDVPALAISVEPHGGSPTRQPTGPVLYTGPCVKYW
jgi:anti-sigma-K factor RskA